MFQGLPPISRIMTDITDRYEDLVSGTTDDEKYDEHANAFTKKADSYAVSIDCGSSHKMEEAIEIARDYAKRYSCVVTINAYDKDGISIGKCDCLPDGGVWG